MGVRGQQSIFPVLLHERAVTQPHQRAYTFLSDGETTEQHLTYGELDVLATLIAERVRAVAGRGDCALLLCPPGLEYVAGLFGCLKAGVAAVPAYPPSSARISPRLQTILSDSGARVALTITPIYERLSRHSHMSAEWQNLHWVVIDDLEAQGPCDEEWEDVAADDLAILQYTSGSTAAPKGVMLTHSNLLANSAMIHERFGHSSESCGVSWLPPYHDMGLIGGILQPMYGAFPVILMAPLAFLQRPLRWLQAITRYRATTSGGPNFAFELCVSRIRADQRESLDLSSWDVAFSGSDTVRHDTIDRFSRSFAASGFRRRAFYPCYGLAESTLLAAGGSKLEGPTACAFERAALEENRALMVPGGTESSCILVSCGKQLQDHQIAIVDPTSRIPCPDEHIGEIWLSGPSVAQGYWQQPEQTTNTFRAAAIGLEGTFLRTGDLGFLRHGELFVTGRHKDAFVIRGRNHYPQDIEATVQHCHPTLRDGRGVAFIATKGEDEVLVVAHELSRGWRQINTEEIAQAVRSAVALNHGLAVYETILLKYGSLPVTTSGKVQRASCQALYLDGGWSSNSAKVVAILHGGPTRSAALVEVDAVSLQALAPNERHHVLVDYLLGTVAQALNVNPNLLRSDVSLPSLGLDSLQGIELLHTLEEASSVMLPTSFLLQDRTIDELATQVGDLIGRPDDQQLVIARPSIRKGLLTPGHLMPLSHGQRALWFLHQFAPHSAAYNVATAMRIEGPLNLENLKHAFQILLDRHGMLRVRFIDIDGEPKQWIEEGQQVSFQVEDAALRPISLVDQLLRAEAERPFDLERGPVFRVIVYRCSPVNHILLIVAHHIVVDLWSLTLLGTELRAAYVALQSGKRAELTPLTVEYADYVHWHQRLLESTEGERLWQYWRQQLSGAATLNLATDHPRPDMATFRGSTWHFHVPGEITSKLRALARSHDATLYMVLLSAFQTLLHRYTGQEDILVGSPVSGRTSTEFGKVVGYFANPIVVRADLSGNPRFRTLLSRVRTTVLAALDSQAFPFASLVERLSITRDASRSPLFQVMFTFQTLPPGGSPALVPILMGEPEGEMPLDDLVVRAMRLAMNSAQFDLSLTMAEVRDGLMASIQFNADLFDSETIERMANALLVLLEAIVDAPEQRLSRLPLLSPSEREQTVHCCNATTRQYPEDQTIHALLEDQVKRTPSAIAIVSGSEKLTFRELNRRANQLARYLARLGVGPETPVGLLVGPSLDSLVGVFGILKAGGAYLPISDEQPPSVQASMLSNARAPILISQKHLLNRLPPYDGRIVCLDHDWDEISRESARNLTIPDDPNRLCHIIYTSGSTGRPKGVMATHRSVANLWWAMDEALASFGRREQWQVALLAPLSFDGSVREYLTLLHGCTVHMLPARMRRDADALLDYIESHRIDQLYCTPSQLYLLLAAGFSQTKLHRPRLILLGGEPISQSMWRDLARLEGTSFFNIYGPTECTVDSTICRVQRPDGHPLIGTPLGNVRTYVLDDDLSSVPTGVPAELYIGGPGVARGYANQPDLTAELFVPNPFSEIPGERLYKTGDIVRSLPDGSLEYIGRRRRQFKVNGLMVDLNEVESALNRLEAICAAAVDVRHDPTEGSVLVGYVVPISGSRLIVTEIRHQLAQLLPEHMIPRMFGVLDHLPITVHGKVDREALSAMPLLRPESGSTFEPPTNSLEEVIASAWAHLLDIERVGANDNFFDIGGSSITTVRARGIIQETLGITVPLVALFQNPTVRTLAAYLSNGGSLVQTRLVRSRGTGQRRRTLMRKDTDD